MMSQVLSDFHAATRQFEINFVRLGRLLPKWTEINSGGYLAKLCNVLDGPGHPGVRYRGAMPKLLYVYQLGHHKQFADSKSAPNLIEGILNYKISE